MTKRFARRIKIYKDYLRRKLISKKGYEYQVGLPRLTVRDVEEHAREAAAGISFSNVARDIRIVTEPGENYDPEFDLLWRGQVLPQIIERYNEKFLAWLIKGVVAPSDMDARLAEVITLPGGRRPYQEF